jgi:hypothetical protein
VPVDDSVHEDLDGVLVGEEVDDLEGVLDDAHRHQLLAVVAAVHHERVRDPARVHHSSQPHSAHQYSLIPEQLSPSRACCAAEVRCMSLIPSSIANRLTMRRCLHVNAACGYGLSLLLY